MFLKMQAMQITDPEVLRGFMTSVQNYPAFSNGVTLGGHGVLPKEMALGGSANGRHGCLDCHGEGGVLESPVPVTRTREVTLQFPDPQNPGQTIPFPVELPIYQWRYYNLHALIDKGLTTQDEDVVNGTASVGIGNNNQYVRTSPYRMVLNWFSPQDSRYRRADTAAALGDTGLQASNLTWNGGEWMPVMEPLTKPVPNYSVLGYEKAEVIWDEFDQRLQ